MNLFGWDVPHFSDTIWVAILGALPVLASGLAVGASRTLGKALVAMQRRRRATQKRVDDQLDDQEREQKLLKQRVDMFFAGLKAVNERLEDENKRLNREIEELRERMREMQQELDLCRQQGVAH